MTIPAPAGHPAITAASRTRTACICGGDCGGRDHDAITTEQLTRMRAYLAAHPGHQFATAGPGDPAIFAILIPCAGQQPPVIIQARPTLPALLDAISAPPATSLS
jgi:hypothetical protein